MAIDSNQGKNRASQGANFWKSYLNLAINKGIPRHTARWYVNWLKQFVTYLKNDRLYDCTEDDVKNYLADLMLKDHIEPWQIEQARSALAFLYGTYWSVPWVLQIQEFRIQDHVARLKSASLSRETGQNIAPFKDASPSRDIGVVYESLIKKLRTEIRVRHYSIRTEQAYEQWIRRFLHFHQMKPANQLSGHDIKVYLDYLATHRTVAASTQNQA